MISVAFGEDDDEGGDFDYAEISLSADDAKLLAMAIMRVAEFAEAKK